ncbi:hypothetical protein [Pedobacter miscanthi]|uniref:Uncharacterized protein n=1 Tax=Pedobacter miscanthi TaxID=2259170 RepID=A0A366KWB5_9SPHI|nr:hypothetical protein [Pedobacter miscanthi]RBQ05848.1 hypothetical protein DRW42_15225 [Pedobacter miscanthi]
MKSIDEEFRWKLLKAGVIFGILLTGLTYFIPDAKPKTPEEELLLETCIPCYMGYLQINSNPIDKK